MKNARQKIKVYFLVNSAVIFLFFQPLFAQEIQIRVIKENAVLKTISGDMLCPANTSFKAVKKDDSTFEAVGECFGFPVKGFISATDVEIVSSSPPEKPKENAAQSVPAASEQASRQQKEKDKSPASPATPSFPISYLGKTITPEFAQFFYDRIKDEYCLKNINSKDLILKEKVPTINSLDDCKSINDGDIVLIDGNVSYASDDCLVIFIFNELYTSQNSAIRLVRNLNEKGTASKSGRTYKGYAILGNYNEGETPFDDTIKFSFKEADRSDLFMNFDSFLKSLSSGETYQIKCPKCEGKGQKKDHKGRMQKCLNCKGTGLLSPENTITNLEQEFKKRSGK